MKVSTVIKLLIKALLSLTGHAMLHICLQLVSFNSTKHRMLSFIISYVSLRFTLYLQLATAEM